MLKLFAVVYIVVDVICYSWVVPGDSLEAVFRLLPSGAFRSRSLYVYRGYWTHDLGQCVLPASTWLRLRLSVWWCRIFNLWTSKLEMSEIWSRGTENGRILCVSGKCSVDLAAPELQQRYLGWYGSCVLFLVIYFVFELLALFVYFSSPTFFYAPWHQQEFLLKRIFPTEVWSTLHCHTTNFPPVASTFSFFFWSFQLLIWNKNLIQYI